MHSLRAALFGVGCLALAACSTPPENTASPGEVARAAYVYDGPPAITLYTVINNKTGGGAHSALMVNADQRAIFDPAGSFYHPHLPEVGDVHYGMSPRAVDFYIDYHARQTYRVVEQTIPVTPEVAALAMRRIQSYGAVPKSYCASSVSEILSHVPGFESVPRTMFPKPVMTAFAEMPGVSTRVVRDDSPDDNSGILMAPALLNERQQHAMAFQSTQSPR